MSRRWWVLVGIACLCAAAVAEAQLPDPRSAAAPIVLDQQVRPVDLAGRAKALVDALGRNTPDPLEAKPEPLPWQPYQPDVGYRIDDMVLWVQFDARNASGGKWFLEIGSSGTDRVQLFHRAADGRWIVNEAGDTRAVSEWPLPGRLPTFELEGRTEQPVRYWLRIEHNRIDFAAPLRIYPEPALLASRDKAQFLLGGYFSLAAVIALISLINAAAFRDRNFGAFALFVAALAAAQLALLGVGAQYVWDHWLRWNEMATFVLPGVAGAAALWFVRVVTEPARYSRSLDLAVWGVIAAVLLAVVLEAVLNSRASLFLVLLFTGVALATAAALIAYVWRQGEDEDMHLLGLGFLPLLLMAVFPLARGFNLLGPGPLTQFGLTVGAAVQMPILFYALSVRGSRRREAQVRAAALARTDPLTAVAHSRTLLQRLDGALARSRAQQHRCALLAVKIANFDAVLAEFGREAADRMLVVAASLLRTVAADIDMPARVGDEFVLLLEGPTTAPDAMNRAQRLVAAGLRPTQALPRSVVLKFQVAVGLLPSGDMDAGSSLQWALDGVNAMPADARKLIRPLNS